MANDQAAYDAGLAQGRQDVANKVSSPAPAQYENSPDYADGYSAGFGQASDPQSYAEGQAQGRADTINQRSSAPPAYADPETHYQTPGGPADSYNQGYKDGASAPPYRSDQEAKENADREAREQSQRNTMPTVPLDPTIQPGPVGPPQTTMGPASAEDMERAKKEEEEREYRQQQQEWRDELGRTTPEDVTGTPHAD